MAQKNLKRGRASVKKKQRSSAAALSRQPPKPDAGGDLDGFVVIGRELRGIANRLKLGESYLIVINMALEGQDVEQDSEISKVLQQVLNRHFFEPIRDLENVAATCDGGRRSSRNEDEDNEDEEDDTEGAA